MSTERIYYTISESMARSANMANSMRDYSEGSATHEYRHYVDEVYDVVDRIEEKKPDLLERAQGMAARYSRKLAEYYNAYYRNEASCPSILISGGSNFPVGKKKKQNSRRETLLDEWNYLKEYAEKIEHLLYMEQPILSDDEKAVEKLEAKLVSLKQKQEDMKAANAYYRKNSTLEDCPVLSENEIATIEIHWARGWYTGIPFPSYMLSNNNKNIHATEDRLIRLKAEKEKESSEKEYAGFSVIENTDIMRLQFIFEGKPDQDTRSILKKNGFRWSPKNEAWQRQLTDNARYAAKRIIEEIGGKEGQA